MPPRLGLRNTPRQLQRGLVVQPSTMSRQDIGSAMRAGRAQMLERLGSTAVDQATQDALDHIAKHSGAGVRI